ncbi:hypothetical protein OTU49_009442, partial [Cherax quadricarinatus]
VEQCGATATYHDVSPWATCARVSWVLVSPETPPLPPMPTHRLARSTTVMLPCMAVLSCSPYMKHRDSEVMETLWFRAATIAVPIAGGFILIVLVLLASRMLAKENKRQRMAQVIEERCLKTPLYPGGTSDPIPHHPLYYHSPIIKNSSMAHMNFRAPFEEKPPNYRSPEISICNLEEIKPLNTKSQDEQWDQRDAESPLPS